MSEQKTKRHTAITETPNTNVATIEAYLRKYIAFAEPSYVLPLALWTVGTFCFQEFDAFPYLVVTSSTKRSGKSMLAEQLAFCCSNSRQFAAMTASTLFRSISDEQPTIFFDEAEALSSESASTMRAVLNVGYRKGQVIPRVSGKGISEFPTYCPKVFVLIGDVYDTLRDRSIIITMRRAEAPQRRLYTVAQEEGAMLRETTSEYVKQRIGEINDAYTEGFTLDFLTGRDEEIWMPLFCLARVFCPGRMEELSRCAVDIATEKTADSKRYTVLESDDTAADDEYAQRLLMDLYTTLLTGGKVIGSKEAIDALRAIPTAPWRKFRGSGLKIHDMANLLSRFGVRPVRIAKGSGRGNQKFLRGYKREDVESAVRKVK